MLQPNDHATYIKHTTYYSNNVDVGMVRLIRCVVMMLAGFYLYIKCLLSDCFNAKDAVLS